MLNANVVETVNVGVSILPITIEVPEPILEHFGRLFDNQMGLDQTVALSTTYLIQKSFVTTIRGLIRADEIRRDLERLKRKDDVAHLEAIIARFLSELFAFKTLDLNGKEVASNAVEVEKLFAEVCRSLSERPCPEDSEQLSKDLRAHQAHFVDVVLAMVRDRAADVSTTGPGSSMPAVEKRLQELESQNFEDLVKDYALVATGQTDHKVPLPDIAYRHLTEVENSVRNKLRDDVVNFAEQESAQLDKKRFRGYFGGRRNSLETAYVVKMEFFLLSVRESISRSQRLVILRSALDKVHMFYAVLEGISSAIRAAQSRAEAEAAKLQESVGNAEAATLRSRGDLISETIATAFEATARLSGDHAEREKGHEAAHTATAHHLKDMIELFDLRNQHNTECLVALSTLANHMRVHHSALVNEAGERTAPQTVGMVSRVFAALDRITASQERYLKASQKAVTGSPTPLIA